MLKKLRAHLIKRQKARLLNGQGFTLVELLVVIAIIAILVLIVIIAIDPIQRIHDANDRGAEADVRQVATAVEGCLAFTDRDTGATNTFVDCDNDPVTELTEAPPLGSPGGRWIRSFPPGVEIDGVGLPPTSIRICATGGGTDIVEYTTDTGQVIHPPAPVPACP